MESDSRTPQTATDKELRARITQVFEDARNAGRFRNYSKLADRLGVHDKTLRGWRILGRFPRDIDPQLVVDALNPTYGDQWLQLHGYDPDDWNRSRDPLANPTSPGQTPPPQATGEGRVMVTTGEITIHLDELRDAITSDETAAALARAIQRVMSEAIDKRVARARSGNDGRTRRNNDGARS